jgi:uncharacterized OB-fold protein
MPGIAAVGLHIPRYVITAEEFRRALGTQAVPGIDEASVAGFDEDAVTMGVAAGQRALDAVAASHPDRLSFVTSGEPTDARIVAEALAVEPKNAEGIPDDPPAAMRAVERALKAASSAQTSTLIVASHAPHPIPTSTEEHARGAAAVALLVTPGGSTSWSIGRGQSPLRRRAGDLGATSDFLFFVESNDPSHGTGSSELTRALDARVPVSLDTYLAMRRARPPPAGTEYSQGAYVSMPAYLGEAKGRYRLVGEECAKCGRLHFPPRESCLACGARAWKEKPLKPTGKVYAYTVIGKGAAPSEFLEQQLATGGYATAVIELDDGLRITAMLADVEPAKVNIGMRVSMVFRRIYTQEGFPRYGFKFAPG